MTAKTKDLDIYDLDLPVDPSFYAPPPRLNMRAYCEWCEEMPEFDMG